MAQELLTFYNLDDKPNFETCSSQITDTSTHNFAVDFNSENARCAINLTPQQILEFSKAVRTPGQARCRWLNLWAANDAEREAVRSVVTQYGLSPRLAHLMCRKSSVSNPDKGAFQHKANRKLSLFERVSHLEKATPSTDGSSSNSTESRIKAQVTSQLGSIDITKDLWHFCSLDWGRRYVCISYNALFTSTIDRNKESRKPSAIRVWSSLLLCDDGTVISVYDVPHDVQSQELEAVRRNQVNILNSLSKFYDTSMEHPLFQVSIRPMPASNGENNEECFDAFSIASRLFYYLFDDWRATFELVSGRQHPYRNTLDALRQKMAQSAEVADINSLHQLGRKLIVLQRVYQSYEKMMDRLLQRQRQLPPSTNMQQRQLSDASLSIPLNSHEGIRNGVGEPPYGSTTLTETEGNQITVRLPLGTVARFERLLDRIRLYALTEIEECIAEKESLVFMNFNLVNLKNAAAIEKLTRTTILLAKATILFLPVSLMTGYFSLQLDEINDLYSLKTYWVCFLVVAILTFFLLLSFNIASDKVKGKIVYESLTRTLLRRGRMGRGWEASE